MILILQIALFIFISGFVFLIFIEPKDWTGPK